MTRKYTYKIRKQKKNLLKLCKCECGQLVSNREYVKGHIIPWNRLKQEIRICKECHQEFKVRINLDNKFCSLKCYHNNLKSSMLGHEVTDETRKKLSVKRNKYFELNPDGKNKVAKGIIKFSKSPEGRKKSSERAIKTREENINFGNCKSGHEELLDNMIQELIPNTWTYTGDGNVWLTSNEKHLNPDFMHKTKKKIIEYEGFYTHNKKDTEKRIHYYNDIGYECFDIWPKDLFKDTDEMLNRIMEFSNGN